MTSDSTGSRCRILALSGSPRAHSQSRAALEIASVGARAAGAFVELIDLAEGVDCERQTPGTPSRFEQLAAAADGLLIATPVYHDSFSGLLKLSLDDLPEGLLEGKLAALVSVGGGRFGNALALEHLRTVLRAMGCWTLPRQVVVARASQPGPLEPELIERLDALGRELTQAGRLLWGRAPPR